MTNVASFDVFDTCLTRRIGDPHALFFILGKELAELRLICCGPEEFARLRVGAEVRARTSVAGGEPTIVEIYTELQESFELSEDNRERCINAEIDLERRLVVPVPDAVSRIETARASGSKIIFLSDMYLPSGVLIQMLQEAKCWKDGDECIVSCECRLNKSSGRLFKSLNDREDLRGLQIVHTGNSLEADVRAAESHGWHAQHVTVANLNRYEHIMERFSRQTAGAASFFSGASRMTRLCVYANTEQERVIRDTAAGVAAPILTAYVLWLLQSSRKQGLRQLYFVSRDGEILLDIARALPERLRDHCNLHYLYGSRQAWHLPAINASVRCEFDGLFEDTDFLSVRSQLRRVGLEPNEFVEELSSISFSHEKWDRNLLRAERELLRSFLQQEAVVRRIKSASDANRELLLQYLKEVGALSGAPWGIVDIGWNGRLQRSLTRVVRSAGHDDPAGFYFGLFNRTASQDLQRAYLFDRIERTGNLTSIPSATSLMETFCSGSHGLVMGYRKADESIAPVLSDSTSSFTNSADFQMYRRSVLEFVKHVSDDRNQDHDVDLRDMNYALLQELAVNPSSAEARVWGSVKFEHDQAGAYNRPLAEALGTKHVLEAFLTGTVPKPHEAAWFHGCIRLTSGVMWRAVACAANIGQKMRRKISFTESNG